MTATVLDDRAGVPTRVSFQFTRPLDDPSLVFLVFRDGGLRRLALPPIRSYTQSPTELRRDLRGSKHAPAWRDSRRRGAAQSKELHENQ
jgi:hypothetical protein